MLFAILKTKKLQANCNLRKIHKQFGQRNSGEQHKGRQRSDSAEPDSGDFPKSSVSHETKQESFLGKTVFRIRQKGVPPLLLPASVLQLPRCLVRICNLFHRNNQVANWQVSRNAIAAGKTCCKYNLLRKCGLLAHTSTAFLKNCCTEKLFICLRLAFLKPTSKSI